MSATSFPPLPRTARRERGTLLSGGFPPVIYTHQRSLQALAPGSPRDIAALAHYSFSSGQSFRDRQEAEDHLLSSCSDFHLVQK